MPRLLGSGSVLPNPEAVPVVEVPFAAAAGVGKMDVIAETFRELESLAKRSESVLVAFSGGKDSWVVLDLCSRTFRQVACFFMYFVPDLEVEQSQIRLAEERYNVKVLQYPHWLVLDCLKRGIHCNDYFRLDFLPSITLLNVYDAARADTGIPIAITGQKISDYMGRIRIIRSMEKHDIFSPIKKWKKENVVNYLKLRKIPIPDSHDKNSGGVSLGVPAVLWLHDNYPDDWKKFLEWFPYAEAIVKRREYYGIGA